MSEIVLPAWWPVCGHCHAQVTRSAWTADPASLSRMTLRVDCHGKAETTVWPTEAARAAMARVPFGDHTANK